MASVWPFHSQSSIVLTSPKSHRLNDFSLALGTLRQVPPQLGFLDCIVRCKVSFHSCFPMEVHENVSHLSMQDHSLQFHQHLSISAVFSTIICLHFVRPRFFCMVHYHPWFPAISHAYPDLFAFF